MKVSTKTSVSRKTSNLHSRPLPSNTQVRSRCSTLRCTCVLVSQPRFNVLSADVGGTNARLSLWNVSLDRDDSQEIFIKKYETKNFSSLDAVVRMFLQEQLVCDNKPIAAAFACAGPAEDNRCRMTNLGWNVDGKSLAEQFDMRVAVLNDFEALGYAIPGLSESDCVVINPGFHKPQAPKIVMGPGTGLGAAQLMWDTGLQRYKVWPGEGAHATFAPRGWKQEALARFVTQKFKHCEIEQVACGSGLELIYEFLISDEAANRPTLLPRDKKKDREITADALADGLPDPVALEALDIFLAIIGAEAGNMALRCLAKGGVYIAGGVAGKVVKRAQAGGLLEAYLNPKAREAFHNILKEIPLTIVTNDMVGVIGCRDFAKDLMRSQR